MRRCDNPLSFPFFVICALIIDAPIPDIFGKMLEKPVRFLFSIPLNCAGALILGFLGGYPAGCKLACSLYDKKRCTKSQAEYLLSFTNNSGPAFIIGAVSAIMLNSPAAGTLIYAVHIAACFLCALTMRFFSGTPKQEKTQDITTPHGTKKNNRGILYSITDAVKSSCFNILNVCAFVVFFYILVNILKTAGFISIVSSAFGLLGFDPDIVSALIGGFFEMTTGCAMTASLDAGFSAKMVIISAIISWAGVSIHFQALSFILKSALNPLPYFCGKALHSIYSGALMFFVLKFFPSYIPVFFTHDDAKISSSTMSAFSVFKLSLTCALLVIIAFILLGILAFIAKTASKRAKKIL